MTGIHPLRNLLIGVLGSNFDLYQDRAPELFNRARAKLLLEIEGRPTIRVLRYLDSVAQKLKKEERWHVAILVRSVWTCVAVLHSLFHFVLLLFALPFLVILTPFCSWSGVYHTIQRPLKAYQKKFANKDDAENQYIWVVQKEHHAGVELRSVHALVKEKVNDLEVTLQSKLSRMEDRLMKDSEESKLIMDQKMDRLIKALEGIKASNLEEIKASKSAERQPQIRTCRLLKRFSKSMCLEYYQCDSNL
eukprot:symbB.v1.2.036149.t1/scaffold5036.1/size31615/1